MPWVDKYIWERNWAWELLNGVWWSVFCISKRPTTITIPSLNIHPTLEINGLSSRVVAIYKDVSKLVIALGHFAILWLFFNCWTIWKNSENVFFKCRGKIKHGWLKLKCLVRISYSWSEYKCCQVVFIIVGWI